VAFFPNSLVRLDSRDNYGTLVASLISFHPTVVFFFLDLTPEKPRQAVQQHF